jgi:CheY-like chemotaxis protein
MSAKRALVVDDSKSARAFLARILERHEIAVDAAESAEAAIEYLARNKPDVIFMDHMMPGMDGFQAVQTIKNNPRTSAIPILMYTSQEGDLYLGQARALGAEGVLPKQIKQADVTRLLFQLRLVTDRRGDEQTTFARVAQGMNSGKGNGLELLPANESAIVVSPPDDAAPIVTSPSLISLAGGADIAQLLPQMSLEIRAALDGSVQKELAALRSFIATTLDSQAERLQGDFAVTLAANTRAPELDLPSILPERRAWPAILGWSLALLATAGAAFMSWMWWQQGGELAALRTDLTASYAELESLRARPVVSATPAASQPADPTTVTPAADAPDAPTASTADVALVPTGTARIESPTGTARNESPTGTARNELPTGTVTNAISTGAPTDVTRTDATAVPINFPHTPMPAVKAPAAAEAGNPAQ